MSYKSLIAALKKLLGFSPIKKIYQDGIQSVQPCTLIANFVTA